MSYQFNLAGAAMKRKFISIATVISLLVLVFLLGYSLNTPKSPSLIHYQEEWFYRQCIEVGKVYCYISRAWSY